MSLDYDKFVLFGDSITQYGSNETRGYSIQPALQELYVRKLDVLNRGFSGYNSRHGRIILPKIIEAENTKSTRVKLMTIFWGTNDAVETFQHVDIKEYEQNIDFMIKLAKSNDIKVIVLGPALHDDYTYTKRYEQGLVVFPDTAKNSVNGEYSEVAKKVATQNCVPFVDLWTLFLEYGGWKNGIDPDLINAKDYPKIKELLVDGVHFNPQGYRIVFDGIQKAIKTYYPDLYYEKVPDHLPLWRSLIDKELDDEELEEFLLTSKLHQTVTK
ncbi:DEKNAAC100147 [Brettanomyces naardenensis]|uniref:DEKNAAC100147 n=1 Tax=Brettanomyces naardenensis TaxID=13370 RepID=A0A448YFY3_BRENA|nr:DEKNAAC100147 [Brettanomyces naardenensis]